ncbi:MULTISPECIES: isochorismatase family cysteine hydrolase [unclassified Mycobacterium]|uniref:cysteine hydrolase family protein n=1 Tax=unclassified Mycobacterium TaxID=2642494 RepID=UPI0029C86EA4|nr:MULTISPECIES: isochorismatase family cysteine hydrolase [unclassified Mycobacterium]
MHDVEIPQWVVDRVIKRRGAEHVFTDLDPARTALIVIDMQNAFMLPGVAFVEIKTAPQIVPNINRLAAAMRAARGAVVWIVTTYTDEVSADWSTYYRLSTPENGDRRSNALVKGTEGHQIWADLDVLDDEPVIEKTKFSALVQGSSGLDAYLRERGIDTLLITGCLTDVCCESTARDGMMLNYRVVMVTDANAADTDADHNAALCAVYSTFGDVMPTDMVVDLLR